MINKRDLCAYAENEWDVFIAYYGNEIQGTQCQAEALYDILNGTLLNNGHKLKVYQHTRKNPGGLFGNTPAIAAHSKVFLLVVDKNIPRDSSGFLLEKDESNKLKRLYEEVNSFKECVNYRKYYDEPCCGVVIYDDMDYDDAMGLSTIFAGHECYVWEKEIYNNFSKLKRIISQFLTGDEHFVGDKKSPVPTQPDTTANNDLKKIGDGAQLRLARLPGGKKFSYEQLISMDSPDHADGSNELLQFLPPNPNRFVPDAEILADCDRILARLNESSVISEQEAVFLRFIHDIRQGRKENRLVTRIASIDHLNTHGIPCVRLQPIEYLWIMRMSMLDTPFDDGNRITTLRKKYANPLEENDNFLVSDRLACHTGCGVFIITSDGYLVYQNRFESDKNKVSFFPGKLSYTVSGSYLYGCGSVFDFMNEKIDRELGCISQELYLWELGYEYDYLHYQFSFFAFSEETKDEFVKCIRPRSSQATSFSYFDLRNEVEIAAAIQPERWETSACAVLAGALMSNRFARQLKEKCGINFNSTAFKRYFRQSK